jgi:Ca2+-binding RTX toxin-like protein
VAGTGALNLYGNEFAQSLIGNSGNNVLDGRGGADTMRGLAGNDTYLVDNAGDVVIEATGQGTDDRVIASVSYQLSSGANVERMQTASAASTDAINLIGNNVKQSLFGNAGNNVLDGRGGADTMNGGAGDDTYYVNMATDAIIESAGRGFDKVVASTTYGLSASAEIEHMQTSGISATNAVSLTGNGFVQTLIGNAGNNRLDGKGGADTMNGSFGDDTYVVDNAGDVVIEAAGRGTDKVIASVSYALSATAEVETMQTNGAALTTKIDLTGSNTDQTILGNNGANRLDGKGGEDTLRGFGGADTFIFSTKLTSANVDTILDFNVAQDTIELESAIFTGLTQGSFISEDQFAANTSGFATAADQRIIYETDTGNLYFDANGSAAGGRVLFGVVSTNLALTSDDFFVG